MKKGRPTMPQLLSREEWIRRIERGDPAILTADYTLRKFGPCEVIRRDIDPDTGMMDVDVVISTAALDRDDDILHQDGWELDNYTKNPVVLWAHDYKQPPIAKAEKVWLDGDRLVAKDRFTPQDVNPFGHMIYRMVKGGFLSATSVGFRPLEYIWVDEHKGYDFFKHELMEHSWVPVPSNQEALIAASADGIDLLPMKEWAEKFLDRDPEGDKVALWLPREIVESAYKCIEGVVAGPKTSVTLVTGTTETKPDVTTAKDDAEGASAETYEINNDLKEKLMDELIKTLTEIIKGLREALEALPKNVGEVVAEKLAEADEKLLKALDARDAAAALKAAGEKPPATADDPETKTDDLDEEDVDAIVKAAVEQVQLATSGKLPD